jgi:hypothetical protein
MSAYWSRSVLFLLLVFVVGCSGGKKPIVTYDEYSKVQDGMTYQQVVEIVGEKGEPVVEFKGMFDTSSSSVYKWANSEESLMTAVFVGDKLAQKSQVLLK